MAARSADKPTKRWIGRGRGVFALSSQQMAPTERRPGNPGGVEGAPSLHQNKGSFQKSDRQQEPVAAADDRRPQSAANQPGAADDRLLPAAASHHRQPAAAHQRPPAAAGRGAPRNSSNDQRDRRNNSWTTKPQNGVACDTATQVQTLLAGFSYKANPDSPLGFPELDIKQGQTLTLVKKHPTNEHWWWVRDESGMVGYVPANYMVVKESKPSTLPWLENKKQEEAVPTEKPTWKAYTSAYNRPAENSAETDKDRYYCRLCDKKLNGPKPYGAHMTSKAHKEVVEVAREMGEDV